jgi:hypothetical protein
LVRVRAVASALPSWIGSMNAPTGATTNALRLLAVALLGAAILPFDWFGTAEGHALIRTFFLQTAPLPDPTQNCISRTPMLPSDEL